MDKLIICPKCSHIIAFDSYFKAYYCRQCGYIEGVPKTIFEVLSLSPENMADYLSMIAPFSICDLVCGNGCAAISNFGSTSKEQCKEKIRNFLNKSVADKENIDGENDAI